MNKSKIIELTVFGLWLLIALILYLRLRDTTQFVPQVQEYSIDLSAKSYLVKQITVIDGNTFDLSLRDDLVSRVLGELPLKSTTDARKKVIEVLNKAANPRVVLNKKKDDGKWLIDLTVSLEGKDVDLKDWMKQNNLVYN